MKKILSYVLHPLALALYGFLALAALVWWIGPLIGFRGVHPLDDEGNRLLTILAIALLFALVLVIKAWRRRRANAAVVQSMKGGPSAADREAEVLGQRFDEALKVLQDSAKQSGKRGLFGGSTQALYDLPWYMFIGAPGSGKTTALMNAGLTFPLAGKMGQASIKGVGGTRNCDWWFTDEAVLIDTAGRYTLQQSDEKTDSAAWENFLALLKKSRPRRPINGVMLTVNVQDLLQQSPAERKEHAARLRSRIQELHERLGVRPPVYVLVTKCDLIAGFNETFGDLGKDEREQVWGFSFTYDPHGADSPLQQFGSEYAALEKRLRDRLLDAMQAEGDVMKRAAIFAFPQQFGGLKGLLGGFLESVFEGGQNLEQKPLLRGVYFTSGTQEGTPIDRVMGTLARTFGVDAKPASIAAARGKSFFLSRLLKQVIFGEQGLVGENAQAESRRRRMRLLGLTAIGLVAVAVLAGWVVSYSRNKAYIDEVQARLPDVKAAVDALPAAQVDVTPLPQVLDKVAAAPVPADFPLDAPPLLNGLGLYQGTYLAGGEEIGYRHLLDKALLPRVTRRLEERLRAASKDNLELAYEALKAYLMLYTPEHFDADALQSWVQLDWEQNLGSTLSAEQRESLGNHLAAALANGAPTSVTPMDKTLVANVRDMLVAYPLEYRIFSRLKRANVGGDFPEFSVASAGGPNAVNVFERASGKPLTRGIPGLFTRDAYFKAFKGQVERVAKQLAEEERWVLDVKNPVDALAKASTGAEDLDTRVRRLYLQEYIKVWDAYIADVRLVKLGGLDRSLAVARLLAAPDSPLTAYMRAIARETQLEKLALEARAAAAKGKIPSNIKIPGKLGKAQKDLAALTGQAPVDNGPKGPPDRPIESMVDDHFANIQRMVTGTPAPIDDVAKLFNEVFVQLTAVDAAQKSKSPPPPAGGGAAKAAAALQPEPIKSMLETLADAGANQSRTAERQGLSTELQPIADFCKRTIAGRYPFAQGAKADVLPDDFGQLFGAGGMLDDFYARRLVGLVDTGVSPWKYKPLPDGSTPPGGGAALADFERAAKIKEAYFRAGGKQPGFKVDLRVIEMSDGMKDLTLDFDGTVLKFTAGNTAAQTVTWPSPRIAAQLKLSEGTGTPQVFEGPWALMRMFSKFEVQPSAQPERFTVVLNIDGKKAKLEVISASAINPLRMREIAQFRCPEAL